MKQAFKIFYYFLILKTFLWGCAVGILGQQFHTSFHFFSFINRPIFGMIMIVVAGIAGYDAWKPVYKRFPSIITASFLIFCTFQMSCVVLGYLSNKPIDGAWARNFAELSFIFWTVVKLNFSSSKFIAV